MLENYNVQLSLRDLEITPIGKSRPTPTVITEYHLLFLSCQTYLKTHIYNFYVTFHTFEFPLSTAFITSILPLFLVSK